MQRPEISLDLAQCRISLEALDGEAVVLCASLRLARNLRRDHDQLQRARGKTHWYPLRALTVAQWLDGLIQESLLVGEIAAATAPRLVLDGFQERILWDRAIGALAELEGGALAELEGGTPGESGGGSAGSGAMEETLFDREGLAVAAAEANALMAAWNIRVPLAAAEQSQETRQFLRWREEFRRICDAAGWFDAARYLDWQIDCLKGGAGRLPRQLALAGFDRYNPQEARLAQVLVQRGVAVLELEQGLPEVARTTVASLPDRGAECRAAVAWARRQLLENPAARLGIVVPELGALRQGLAALLDDALDPQALRPALAEMPRRYNFSLGLPLARQPCVAVALQLLACAVNGRVSQEEFTALLRAPYWSADVAEADGRARLDALMREQLAPTLSFERMLRFIRKSAERGLPVGRLLGHLEAFKAALAAQPARQVPSSWALGCRALLDAIGWPGERSLSSHEYQAGRAFAAALDSLAGLDTLLGRVTLAEARRRLAQICRERIFQPETIGDPPVQVMGLLEIADTPLDAIWVMGMNEHLWPPPARPNPLLPAELQRLARAPNASAEVQREFAQVIQRRLLRSAPRLWFSWARGEADRLLRPSPLLSAITLDDALGVADTLSALPMLADGQIGGACESIADERAPPLAPGETIRGGAKLLQAQAICPAWAFYRYRLGAKSLETPAEGLDARARGNLLHAVLERFWRARGSAELQAMSTVELDAAVVLAIAEALAEFNAALDEPLAPRLIALERERLLVLVVEWLALEAQRGAAFRVVAQEQEAQVDIEGIAVRLRVDRIDELDDGRRVIIDYKSGGQVSPASWAAERIDEPQLPIYAAFLPAPAYEGVTVAEGIAAVVFARVRLDECAFVGIATDGGLLPKVAGLMDARKLFPEDQFPDWESLIAHWRSRIAAIAREIREGHAAVVFTDEKALAYCEVKPLLRLPEVRAQRQQSRHTQAAAGEA